MKYTFVILIGIPFFLGCHNSTEPVGEPAPQVIFASSFESAADTIGWTGQGDWKIYSEAAPSAGSYSFWVSGTDILPHATKIVYQSTDTTQFILRFWAKCLWPPRGSVYLISFPFVNWFPRAAVLVTDTVWKSYADSVTFPPGTDLAIEINGNGAFDRPILVDKIEVLKIIK